MKPNLDGEFCVSILHVNLNKVKLFKSTRISLVTAAEKILEVKPRDEIPSSKPQSIDFTEIHYGSNIHSYQKRKIDGLIESYSDILAKTPKKQNITNVLFHKITEIKIQ